MISHKFLFEELKKIRKIKKRDEIRAFRRKPNIPPKQEEREYLLTKGSIWAINDSSVPFDGKRRPEDIKNTLRPTVVLKTPQSFDDYDLVFLAPGTSKNHDAAKNSQILVAKSPPETLKETTWFLLRFSWWSVQKKLDKKITDLSPDANIRLDELLGEIE